MAERKLYMKYWLFDTGSLEWFTIPIELGSIVPYIPYTTRYFFIAHFENISQLGSFPPQIGEKIDKDFKPPSPPSSHVTVPSI